MSVSVAGVVARVERRTAALARQLLDAIVGEVPLYAHLPREQLEGEILDICAANIEFFFHSLAAGGRPSPDALAEVKASAARRAQERVPLDAVLAAYHVGSRVAWAALCEEASAREREELVALADPLMVYVQAVTGAVADAYVEEQGSIAGAEREARHALLDAVLAGGSGPELERRFGERVASRYLVGALEIGPSTDEADNEVEVAVAARRKVRRIEQFLAEVTGDGVLFRVDERSGLVLVPVGDDGSRAALDGLAAWVEQLVEVADAGVMAGAAAGEPRSDLREVATQAREVLRLASAVGVTGGVHTIDDVLLEYLVARPGAAGECLAGLLAALDGGPDLVVTLDQWFATDFDRRETAARLHVHPNTLDYRLGRVTALTGLDPTSARGIQLLGAALLLRRIDQGES